MTAWLACDWGTTTVRAWRVECGVAVAEARFPFGVSRLDGGSVATLFRDRVRPALGAGSLPAVICGMAGSSLGWTPVPYVACPADLDAVAAGALNVEPGIWLAPGLRLAPTASEPDVMRGEETQLLGWLTTDRGGGLFCLPGTHSKWARVEAGRIVDFATAMTGELFASLRSRGLLATDSDPCGKDGFDAGLAAAGDGSALAFRLFGARARRLIGTTAPGEEADFLSGLLVGAEVAAGPYRLGAQPGEEVVVIGEPVLAALYVRALAVAGRPARQASGDEMSLAGLSAIWRQLRA